MFYPTRPGSHDEEVLAERSFSSLLEQYQLTEEECSRRVSRRHLEFSTWCQWRDLPPYLEMDAFIAEDIDHRPINEDDKRCAFFVKWRDVKGSGATYGKLITSLLKIRGWEYAERLCEMLQDSPPSYAGRLSNLTPWNVNSVIQCWFSDQIIIPH